MQGRQVNCRGTQEDWEPLLQRTRDPTVASSLPRGCERSHSTSCQVLENLPRTNQGRGNIARYYQRQKQRKMTIKKNMTLQEIQISLMLKKNQNICGELINKLIHMTSSNEEPKKMQLQYCVMCQGNFSGDMTCEFTLLIKKFTKITERDKLIEVVKSILKGMLEIEEI